MTKRTAAAIMDRPGVFPMGAQDVEFPTLREINDLRAYHVGHGARNARAVLNMRASFPAAVTNVAHAAPEPA